MLKVLETFSGHAVSGHWSDPIRFQVVSFKMMQFFAVVLKCNSISGKRVYFCVIFII